MQENNEIKFDAFIRKRIKEEGLEQPSMGFTHTLLTKIGKESKSVFDKNYQPLISKPIWYMVALILITAFGVLILGDFDSEPVWFRQLMVKVSEFNLVGELPEIAVSRTYVYAFMGLAIFMGVQVYLLKNHFEKRYFMN
jgi:hypothetical protein